MKKMIEQMAFSASGDIAFELACKAMDERPDNPDAFLDEIDFEAWGAAVRQLAKMAVQWRKDGIPA